MEGYYGFRAISGFVLYSNSFVIFHCICRRRSQNVVSLIHLTHSINHSADFTCYLFNLESSGTVARQFTAV